MTTTQFVHHTLFAGALAFAAFLTACDRTVETKEKTVSGPNGTTVQKESTVQHSDGTVTVDKESHSSTP